MVDDRLTEMRDLKAQLQALQHPAVWGVGLFLLLLLWFWPDDRLTADRSGGEKPVEVPLTVSSSAENSLGKDSGPDLGSLLTDPTLAKFGLNGVDNALQLGLLDSLLTSPFSADTSEVRSSSLSESSIEATNYEPSLDELSSVESSLAQSFLQPSSRLRSSVGRLARDSNNQAATTSMDSSKPTIDRRSKSLSADRRNLWQVDFSTNLATHSGNSSATNLYGQPENSPSLESGGQVARSAGDSSVSTQASPSFGPAVHPTPPAFRVPTHSVSRSASGSNFTTPNSSQIIQTFEPPPSPASKTD